MEGPCPPPPLPPSTSYRGKPLLLDLVGGEEHPFKSVETDDGLAEVHFSPWIASSTGWAVPNLADAASHPASPSFSLNSDRQGRTVLWC